MTDHEKEAGSPSSWSSSGLEEARSPEDIPKCEEGEEKDEEQAVPAQSSNTNGPALSKWRTAALVATLTGAAFLNTLAIQATIIVLPSIGRDLNIVAARQQWIVSSYSLTFGCFLLLWGRLADVYGRRLLFICGSAWVAAMAIAIPFCPNEVSFDILRALQGLGAAANVPTAIGILGATFAPGKAKNYAFSIYSSGAPMGAVLGNVLGGIVAQYASWKWIFWILAIMAAIVTLAGHLMIPRSSGSVPPASDLKNTVDWLGGFLVTAGLLCLMLALTEGNVVGWTTPWVLALIGVSVVLLVTFVLWQVYLEKKTTHRPLMKVSVFSNRRFSAAMAVMGIFFSSFNNFSVFATYLYQDFQGLDPIQTALRFLPLGVVGFCIVLINSQLLATVRVHYILMWSAFSITVASLLFAIPLPINTTYWAYGFPAMCIAVSGVDTLYPSLTLFTAHSLPPEDQALGGGLINAVAQVGRAIGLAVGTAMQVAVQANREGATVQAVQKSPLYHNLAFLDGIRTVAWFDFAFGVVGFIVVVLFLRGAGKIGAVKK